MQIVGSTLRDGDSPQTLNISEYPADWFAARYREDRQSGGHVIKLGPDNDDAARSALAAWPGGLQVGGGINAPNASDWLEAGADKVIVTSWLFPTGKFDSGRANELIRAVGAEHVVIDLSCRRVGDAWRVATDRWQTTTATRLGPDLFGELAAYCSEFLVHATDVEGRSAGVDRDLIAKLADWTALPCTYAGGARQLGDLDLVSELSGGRVDLTIGSALDLFGGSAVRYEDCVEWNRVQASSASAESRC